MECFRIKLHLWESTSSHAGTFTMHLLFLRDDEVCCGRELVEARGHTISYAIKKD